MEQVTRILSYLEEQQSSTGEFQTYCCLPDGVPKEWYYSGGSPFVSANILFCIRNIDNTVSDSIRNKGVSYLLSLKEEFGLWRYWGHENGIMEYNVPTDMDDSALVAFILKRQGIDVSDVLDLLLKNQTFSGRFYTWFLPRFSFFNSPKLFLELLKELKKTIILFLPNPKIPKYEPISSPWDSEQAVSAHAIMALGEACPQKCIDQIISDIKKEKLSLQYYDHKFYVYQHVSRSYLEGVDMLVDVKEKITEEIRLWEPIVDVEDEFYILNVLNFLTLKNFGADKTARGKQLLAFLKNDEMLMTMEWKPYKYWTSKQRSWWAGSPELTAALYLEAFVD